MVKSYILLVSLTLVLAFAGCKSVSEESAPGPLASLEVTSQLGDDESKIPVVDFEGLKPLLERSDSSTYVINFWATWCAPCIKELPYFEQLHIEMKAEGVEVILVSLDMPTMWESHLIPFVKKKDLQSTVVVLDDPDQNTWIPQVDENWAGAIPATLIYNSKSRAFYEKPFEKEELFQTVTNILIKE